MLHQLTLWDTPNAISSQGSASGVSRSAAPAGQTIAPSGPDHAPANLSARQAKALGLMTSGTFGPPCIGLSRSADLQSFLENRLRKVVQLRGSTLYKLTWKPWVTPSGRSRFRLLASVPRSSGTASISALPSPTARDHRGRYSQRLLTERLLHPRGVPLSEFMQRAFGRPGYLNPELPRLLMALPPEWDACAPTATPSTRKRPASSSKQ